MPTGLNWNPKVVEGEIGFLAVVIGEAIEGAFESPNESDANVVDALFEISRAIHRLAQAVEGVAAHTSDPL